MTDQTPAEPLSAEEEADIRAQLAYVRREQGEPYGWQQDTARLLATLDAERAAHTGSDCVLDRFGLTPHSHFCRSDEDRAALAVDEAKHLWPVSDVAEALTSRGWSRDSAGAGLDKSTGATDDEYRDAHERAFRDHILGGPDDHRCDDLCSAAILDRIEDRPRVNEYPLRESTGAGLRCVKCGGTDISTRWDSTTYDCTWSSRGQPGTDKEHLHRYCRICLYGWGDPVAALSVPQEETTRGRPSRRRPPPRPARTGEGTMSGWYCPDCGATPLVLPSGLETCPHCGSIGLRGYERTPRRLSCEQHPGWSGWDDGGVNDDLGRHRRLTHQEKEQ